MFQKILVPVDGSDTAWKALKTAAALASRFQGEIRVFTVMEPYNSLSLFQITLDQNLMDRSNREMKKASLAVLDTAKEKLTEYGFHGKVSYEDGEGNPAELILEKSREDGCDSVVIGSRGLSGITEFLLGSVSSKVSQYAEVPVFVVK
ncbi:MULTISPECIES: universal stress protein [Acidaminococcus]|uniref:Universal stress protein n=1 Tax=Acidaminococcus fermentans TaxID=905 RepID=A0A6N7VKF5_ACIFE|nr:MULTISPECIES: universal stress protein [Acidaminococcus]MEE1598765.1 universal stress protein [Acidaminococcus fermentans]MEE4123027.1 universal stress protein [Acidaminococcus fermentans]MSS81530.1 universal stress protein [Acidaminococcus fermentans]